MYNKVATNPTIKPFWSISPHFCWLRRLRHNSRFSITNLLCWHRRYLRYRMAGNRVLLRVSIRPAMSWVPWSGLRVSFRWEVRAGVLMCSIKIVTHLFARQATTMAYPDAMPVFEGLYAFRSVFQERKGLRVFRLSICNIP